MIARENPHAVRRIAGRALPLRGDDIDTDRIMPARFLRSVSFDGLAEHLFEDERRSGAHPFADSRYEGAAILLVNRNFGCGSSREHAPQALYRWGIRAIVGESFPEIFRGNSTMIGLPCIGVSKEGVERLMALVEDKPHVSIAIDVETLKLTAESWSLAGTLAPAHQQAFVTGAWDSTGMLLDDYAEVRATADRLPYLRGF